MPILKIVHFVSSTYDNNSRIDAKSDPVYLILSIDFQYLLYTKLSDPLLLYIRIRPLTKKTYFWSDWNNLKQSIIVIPLTIILWSTFSKKSKLIFFILILLSLYLTATWGLDIFKSGLCKTKKMGWIKPPPPPHQK